MSARHGGKAYFIERALEVDRGATERKIAQYYTGGRAVRLPGGGRAESGAASTSRNDGDKAGPAAVAAMGPNRRTWREGAPGGAGRTRRATPSAARAARDRNRGVETGHPPAIAPIAQKGGFRSPGDASAKGRIPTNREQAEMCGAWKRAAGCIAAIEAVMGDRPIQSATAADKSAVVEQSDGVASWAEVEAALRRGAEARSALWRGYHRLVYDQVNRYAGHLRGTPDYEDVLCEGFAGLLYAAEMFDPSRAGRLSTLAVLSIRQRVLRTAHQVTRLVHVPFHLMEIEGKIRKAYATLQGLAGRPPTMDEIAEELGMPVEKLVRARRAMRGQRFLEDCSGAGWGRTASGMGAGRGASAEELVDETMGIAGPDARPGDPARGALEASAARRVRSDVEQLLGVLPAEQAAALRKKFGIDAEAPGPGAGAPPARRPGRGRGRKVVLGAKRSLEARRGMALLRSMVDEAPRLREALVQDLRGDWERLA